jgi:hypothetical protein
MSDAFVCLLLIITHKYNLDMSKSLHILKTV